MRCKLVYQDKSTAIVSLKRSSSYQSAGVGKVLFLDGTKRYKNLIGTKCNHEVTYVDKNYFVMWKCNSNDESFSRFKNK